MKNERTAIAYIQGALNSMEKAVADGDTSRELSIAFTTLETALMWAEKDADFKQDAGAKQAYLAKRQPYLPPEFMDVAEIEKLTLAERVAMFGYDPLEETEQ